MAVDDPSLLIVTDETPGPVSVEGRDAPSAPLCGRCRKPLDGHSADPPAPQVPWSLCPPCRVALIGGTGRGRRS